MTTSNVLVTGAAGRLGSVTAARIHAAGHDVLATDLTDPGDTPYRFEAADLLDHERVLALLDGIDVVLHIGNIAGIGWSPPQVVFSQNVTMNANVFQGAAEQGVGRIVFASTLQLIGSWPDARTIVTPAARPAFPMTGATEPDPSNLYALSKTVSERMLRYYAERCGVDGVAIRFPLLHHRDDPHQKATGEEDATAIFEGFTSLTYDEAADLFAAVIDSDLAGYHVFMPGSSRRHRDLDRPELITTFYPDVDPATPDLIDNTAITAATGWRLTDPA